MDLAALHEGLKTVRLQARFQNLPGDVECVLDVAHNPAAARVLGMNLAANPIAGKTFAVIGMLRDKAAEEVVHTVASQIDAWFVGGLGGPRGQSAAELVKRIHSALPDVSLTEYPSVANAYHAARSAAGPGDRIVVFGSFQTVSAILRLRQESDTKNG